MTNIPFGLFAVAVLAAPAGSFESGAELSAGFRVPGRIRVVLEQTSLGGKTKTLEYEFSEGRVISTPVSGRRPKTSSSLDLEKDVAPDLPGAEGVRFCPPYAWSPTRDRLAVAFKPKGGTAFVAYSLAIVDSVTKVVAARAKFERFIQDIAWSPGADLIAVLTSTEHWGVSPPEIVAGLTGHPIPHDAFFLDIIRPSGESVGAVKITSGLKWGKGNVVWSE